MATLRRILFVMIIYTTLSFVKSAPSQPSHSTEVTPEHTIQEIVTSDNLRVTTSGNNSSSKIVATSNNTDTQDVGASDKDTSEHKVSYLAGTELKKTGVRSNVMALSDDVITDALFTNIDTLQDHLEVCEEGLRQQLRLLSHGQLLQEVAAEETVFPQVKAAVSNKRNKNDEEFEEGEDNDDVEDTDDADNAGENDFADEINDEMMLDGKDSSMSTHVNVLPGPTTKHENVRGRRSVMENSNVERAPGKADNLAQKVVSRLSGRLEYLKASLIQCHLLYRQFGQL